MKELIKIEEKDGKQAVSARELYLFLDYNISHWSRWSKKNIVDNQFALNLTDYVGFTQMVNGNIVNDYALTLDFAKKIAMMANTKRGEDARNYFIECEKKAKEINTLPNFSNPAIAARAWAEQYEAKMIAEARIEKQNKEIKELEPKGEFYDSVTGSNDTIDIGQVAKVLNKGIGRNKLFQLLRDNSVLMRNNQPYQNYIDRDYFRVIESEYQKADGSTHISLKTVVFQKGVEYISKLIDKNKTT